MWFPNRPRSWTPSASLGLSPSPRPWPLPLNRVTSVPRRPTTRVSPLTPWSVLAAKLSKARTISGSCRCNRRSPATPLNWRLPSLMRCGKQAQVGINRIDRLAPRLIPFRRKTRVLATSINRSTTFRPKFSSPCQQVAWRGSPSATTIPSPTCRRDLIPRISPPCNLRLSSPFCRAMALRSTSYETPTPGRFFPRRPQSGGWGE